jgi:hypothetical protein
MNESCQPTFPVKVQEMRSKNQKPRYYIYIPVALSSALGITSGEEMSWEVLDRNELHLVRLSPKATTTPLRAKGKKSAPL